MKQRKSFQLLHSALTGAGLFLYSFLAADSVNAQIHPYWNAFSNVNGTPAAQGDNGIFQINANSAGAPNWVNTDLFNLYPAATSVGSPLGYIQATVWDDPVNNVVRILLYNSHGGTYSTLCTIADAQHPDVVIGEPDTSSATFGKDLILGVVYEDVSNPSLKVVKLRTYEIQNIFSGAFSLNCATPLLTEDLSTTSNDASNPHIDMVPEAFPPTSMGFTVPTIRRFAAVWDEDNAGTKEVYIADENIDATSVAAGTRVDDGERPDVAFARSMPPGGTQNVFAYLIYAHDPTKEVRQAEMDMNTLASPTFNSSQVVDRGDVIAPPRIEALNYTEAAPHMTLWTAVAEIQDNPPTTGLSEIHLYCQKASGMTITEDLSACDVRAGNPPVLTSGSVANPLYNHDGYSPTVAAGNGEHNTYTNPGAMGNMFYTTGWYIDTPITKRYYDALFIHTHGPNVGQGYDEINQFPLDATAPASGSCRLAMVNTSNDGSALASAWYNKRTVGANSFHLIMTKYSSTLSPAFKPTDIPTVTNKNGWLVYPNPATNLLTISGKSNGTYMLTDMSGRSVQKGIMTRAVESVNIANLPQGIYMLQLSAGIETTTVRVVKQ